MDVIFGSEGTAQADFERMEEINREIGLDRIIRGSGAGIGGELTPEEKEEIVEEKKQM